MHYTTRGEIMKTLCRFISFLILICALAFLSCETGKKDNNNNLIFMLLAGGGLSPYNMETYTADGVSFLMANMPGGTTFPTGTDDLGTPATVANAYLIGETEVTYQLWYKVYTWATDAARGADQYTFTFTGGSEPRAGNDGTPGSETNSQEPVTYVNWRHAMVWCNALTEWYNANNGSSPDLDCAYYTDSGYVSPIRSADDTGSFDGTAGGQDNPYVKAAAKGFRLLTSNEWELAARWRNDATNTVSGYTDPYFTKGDSASGAITYCNDNTDGSGEPGKSANDVVAVYLQYWDGDSWEPTGVTSTATVKSKTTGANALGLYDMSGNVSEWCFELHAGDRRVGRGGNWWSRAIFLPVGYWTSYDSYLVSDDVGFRFAKSL